MRSSVAGGRRGGRVLMRVPGDRRAAARRAREVQRVLHVARGMLRRHVERFEVVVVVLDLGPLEDLVAHAAEDRLDLLADERERMAVAERRRGGRAA